MDLGIERQLGEISLIDMRERSFRPSPSGHLMRTRNLAS